MNHIYEDDPTIVFDGWYLDKDCTESADLYNTTWIRYHVVCKWSQGYRVVFDANGGYFYSYSATKQYWFCNAGGTIGYEQHRTAKIQQRYLQAGIWTKDSQNQLTLRITK